MKQAKLSLLHLKWTLNYSYLWNPCFIYKRWETERLESSHTSQLHLGHEKVANHSQLQCFTNVCLWPCDSRTLPTATAESHLCSFRWIEILRLKTIQDGATDQSYTYLNKKHGDCLLIFTVMSSYPIQILWNIFQY